MIEQFRERGRGRDQEERERAKRRENTCLMCDSWRATYGIGQERRYEPLELLGDESLYLPGKPSTLIRHADDLPPGTKVIGVTRVSSVEQQAGGNDSDQERTIRKYVDEHQLVLVNIYRWVGSGWDPQWLNGMKYGPRGIEQNEYPGALLEARESGAVLLAETTDRLIRPLDYHSKQRFHAQILKADLKRLKRQVGEVELCTIGNPDATPGQNRSTQTNRGLREKGKKGGRQIKGRDRFRKEQWLPFALEKQAEGLKPRAIAKEIKQKYRRVHPDTVRRALLRHKRGTNLPVRIEPT